MKRVRRLELINMGLVGLCMLTWLLGANGKVSKFDEIQCRSLYVVDGQGRETIKLGNDGMKDTPVFVLNKKPGTKGGVFAGYTETGQPLLAIHAENDDRAVKLASWSWGYGVTTHAADGSIIARMPDSK